MSPFSVVSLSLPRSLGRVYDLVEPAVVVVQGFRFAFWLFFSICGP